MEQPMARPQPHLDKLQATLANDKLPAGDRPRIEEAIVRYRSWIREMESFDNSDGQLLKKLVDSLTRYKTYIDIDLIFGSDDDFLYRQKGQLKLDNSIIEEFLPWLIQEALVPGIGDQFRFGPTNCYSAIYFDSTLGDQKAGAGIRVRTKDQDFSIARKLYVKASHNPDFTSSSQVDTYIAYVATEIKTNLDKTMFQEACATARDLRIAVPGARYFMMCEWLDMTPVSTAPTDVEEVLILRRAKRVSSNIRKDFSDSTKRKEVASSYAAFLQANPFQPEVFARWIRHIEALLTDTDPVEGDVLQNGYF